MTEIEFCNKCDNLLYLYSNQDNDKLYLGCKFCGEIKDYDSKQCIYNNEFNINLAEIFNHNQYITNDITLPSIENNPNIKCLNPECTSIKHNKPSNVIYIKYDYDNIKYLYICKYCNQKWTNN